MSKVSIIATIKNNDQEQITKTQSIKTKEEYKYQEKDNTKVVFNYLDYYLKRENDKIIFEVKFIEEQDVKARYYIKELGKELTLNIKTKSIIKKENKLEINYTIDKDKFLYRIEEIK